MWPNFSLERGPQRADVSMEELQALVAIAEEEWGLTFDESQMRAAQSRVVHFLRESGLSLEALMKACASGDQRMRTRLTAALSNGETSFFRDFRIFEGLREEILPTLLRRKQKGDCLNIWTAACSSGQEVYSLSILLNELDPERKVRRHIYATDGSDERLKKARLGKYSRSEVGRGISARRLLQHFDKQGETFTVREELKRDLEFFRLNLLEPWPWLPQMDLILMRNVLMYWRPEQKSQVLKRAVQLLAPGGVLLLGTTEGDSELKRLLPPRVGSLSGVYGLPSSDGVP